MCNSFNKRFLDEASKHWSEEEKPSVPGDLTFVKMAAELGLKGVLNNEGGPFGCVIVKDGEVIGKGNNRVTTINDPTAHAEIEAIRNACERLGSYQLTGCVLYTSCEPCPMCLGAIYWARPDKVFYAATKEDAAASGFDDHFIYEEIALEPGKRSIEFRQLGRDEALRAFRAWDEKEDKIEY